MEDRRELVLDHVDVSPLLNELWEKLLAAALRSLLLDAFQGPLPEMRVQPLDELVRPQGAVPQLERRQQAELGHRLAVAADAGRRHVFGHGLLEAIVTTRHDEARGESLDVPLPGRRQRFVEIVDGEDHAPLRRGEPAEIGEVRIPAALHADPAHGRGREVARHREGRSAVEGERRAHHAPMAQREQVRHSSLLRSQDRAHGISPVVRSLPRRVDVAGASLSQGLARCTLFRPRSRVPGQGGCLDTAAASRTRHRNGGARGLHGLLPSSNGSHKMSARDVACLNSFCITHGTEP